METVEILGQRRKKEERGGGGVVPAKENEKGGKPIGRGDGLMQVIDGDEC